MAGFIEGSVIINGVTYISEDSLPAMAEEDQGYKYCMIRTYSAGVFAGYLDYENLEKQMTVYKARRIWKWAGAASLSQLAAEGTSDPENCKFPCEVQEVKLTEIIEVIPMTKQAKESIAKVKEWKA